MLVIYLRLQKKEDKLGWLSKIARELSLVTEKL